MINAIAIDDEPLALTVIASLCAKSEMIHLQKTFTQPSEALRHLRKFPADLIFCDIQMPAMTGINLVRSLQQDTMVIFTTAFSEYAVVSYELNAIDYLLKPINQKRFTQAINKAQEYFEYLHKKDDTSIFVRADFSLVKIPVADILYIEGLADYLKIHIKDRKPIVARMPMKDMMEKLQSADFIRVHRSYILPFSRIGAVRGTTIIIGDREFPIGKTYVAEFFARYSH
ncbi:LytR/AlgR family response regulator transcription factor [Chitinophaga sancti]|uniref:LytTR family DNA-binding domain-containing protein n=1 Tax=Chitinophaga sancti TaxID=1004 RepID=A0A1K1QY38_9BACT|nr:LytTR family DNA-binding domain-containing protein [Chitinophaga sancti]WQD62075.1 LytTR family DNA-binding domain-containing protein [Chitinophaga sancti]WQG92356.1 LytTR family DNA-binding domain-containing protein [Chitinophaga sancti]SFW64823.1 two component transcriptional regulator, LytTR family [Chitinophaga sancti]